MPAQSIHAFAEKVALITDGANSVGRAVALQLALQGSYVIVGFSEGDQEAKSALAELQSLGTLAHTVEADVSTAAGAQNLVSEVEKIYGRLDLLINTTNFMPPAALEQITEELWTESVAKNLKSVFFVTQSAIHLMKGRPKPVIVNVASACDAEDSQRNAVWMGVNAALLGLTRSLALQLAPKFRVNCVAVSEKKIISEVLDAELFKPKTGVAADDVARTVVYLLSSGAIALNGQVLTAG